VKAAANKRPSLAPMSSYGCEHMRLLVTRPEPDAERTAAALRERGHFVFVAPLLSIEAVDNAEIGPGPFTAILVTSANAAPAIVRHPRFTQFRALPVFAVGDRSAEAMRVVGFGDVTSANGDVGDLARLVAERFKRGASLLYLAGADRSGDLVGALSGRGLAVRSIVIYRAVAATALPPAVVVAISDGLDGVLHFSRRSAAAYVTAAYAAGLDETALKNPVHFCLSVQVAEPLTQAAATDLRVAPEPTEAALLALVPTP
jgi:uroporphyrinogen-III synthase